MIFNFQTRSRLDCYNNLTYSKFEINPPFLFRHFYVKITLLFTAASNACRLRRKNVIQE